MPVCEGCFFSFSNSFQFCPQCGRAKPIIQEQSDNNLSQTRCPLCNKDDQALKVTSIIQRDTQRINGQVPVTSTYSDGDGRLRSSTDWSRFSATSISDLAKNLTPPDKPALGCFRGLQFPDSSCLTIASAIMAVVLISFGFAMIGEGSDIGSIAAGFIGGILFIGIFIGSRKFNKWQSKRAEEAIKPEMDRWNYAMDRWNKLYYCSRDDCLYIPGEKGSVPIGSMESILYWNYKGNTDQVDDDDR